MVTEKMIEAAARAMCEAWHYAKIGTPDGNAEWSKKQDQYRKQARAALEAALSTEECQYSKDNNIPEHRCAARCVYEEECALSTDAEPVAWVDEQELRYLEMVTGNKAWGGAQRSIKVGGKKEGRSPLYAATPAPAVAVKATPEALEKFTAYFVKNYPGPDTVIFDPKWHAPKIFRAAVSALSAQVQDVAGWQSMDSAPKDGTVIDLWHFEFGRHPGMYWGKTQHCCGEEGKYCDSEWHSDVDGWIDGYLNEKSFEAEEFTHWMPLPLAPGNQEVVSDVKAD